MHLFKCYQILVIERRHHTITFTLLVKHLFQPPSLPKCDWIFPLYCKLNKLQVNWEMVKDLPPLLNLKFWYNLPFCLFHDVVFNNVLSMDYKLRILNRKRLYSLINDRPTLFEVVTWRIPVKDNKPKADGGSKSRNSTKVQMLFSLSADESNMFWVYNPLSVCRDQLMDKQGAILWYLRRVLGRLMMPRTMKPFVEAAGEVTILTIFG